MYRLRLRYRRISPSAAWAPAVDRVANTASSADADQRLNRPCFADAGFTTPRNGPIRGAHSRTRCSRRSQAVARYDSFAKVRRRCRDGGIQRGHP
jgi:hypothetical protein